MKKISLRKNKKFFLLEVFLSVIVVFFTFFGISTRPTFFTDELLIQEAAYNFTQGSTIVFPRIGNAFDLAKPPLVAWTTSLVYLLFSPSLLVARLVSAVFGILTALNVYLISKKIWNVKQAYLSVFLFVISPIYILFTKNANFDMPNAFFTSLFFLSYINMAENKKYLIISSLALGLAIMTRSYLSLPMILFVVLDKMFFKKNSYKAIELTKLLSLVFVIVLPWHVASFLLAGKGFIDGYVLFPIVNQIAGRMSGYIDKTGYYLNIFYVIPTSVFALLFFFTKKLKISLNEKRISIWLFVYTITLFVSARNTWYLNEVLVPVTLFGTIWLVRFINQSSVVVKLIVGVLATSLLTVSSVYVLLVSSEPDTITASKIMVANSRQSDMLFLWNYNIISQTHFFPGRQIKTINNSEPINRGNVKYLLIQNRELNQISSDIVYSVLYKSKDYSLLMFTSQQAKD